MKSILFTLACATLVAAQGSVPTCAQPCVQDATSGDKIAGCAALEISCICKNSNFLDSIACCLEKNCDDAEKEQAVKYAAQICGSAGVKDLPTEVVCKDKDQASSTAAAESGSESSSSSVSSKTTEEAAMTQTKTGTDVETESARTESTQGTETSSGAASEQTGDDGDGAAAGLSAPLGLVGAVLLGWAAL